MEKWVGLSNPHPEIIWFLSPLFAPLRFCKILFKHHLKFLTMRIQIISKRNRVKKIK